MALKVIRIDKGNSLLVSKIYERFIANFDEKPKKKHLKKLLKDKRSYLLAALFDDKIIGYALAYRFPSLYGPDYLAYLYDIEVLENYRRKGAGRLLVETLLGYLGADDVSELWLGTAIDNVEGQALFSSTGAVKSGETFNDFTYTLK